MKLRHPDGTTVTPSDSGNAIWRHPDGEVTVEGMTDWKLGIRPDIYLEVLRSNGFIVIEEDRS